ncbi:MAG TPA: hypothetical protein DCR46_08925 [Cytophagales bacterium]|jgi:hypothetical protein|nr:hypothetical protein [Cytophagales bacterium]
MMALVLVVYWFLGYSMMSFLGKDFNIPFKIGVSMLVGLGMNAFWMFACDILHFPIHLYLLLGLSMALAALLSFKNKEVFKEDWSALQNTQIGFGQVNFSWLFFFFVLCYMVYAISQKGLFWPITEYDSVAGYDYMAKMIAAEQKIKVSLFEYSIDSGTMARFIYPPLVATSYALPYLCGMAMSKIMSIVYFVSLLFGFYGCLRYYTTHLAAIVGTLFMAATPEMFSHAALGLTNLPNAAYASIALISFFIWTEKKTKSWLVLSAVMMAFTLFSRSDSIVFALAVLVWLAYYSFKHKNITQITTYAALSLFLFLAWMGYLKFVIHSNSGDFFEKTLFWDAEKFDKILGYIADFLVWENQFYGIGFWLFYLVLALNYKTLRKDMTVFLVVGFMAWLFYTALYYQMNYKVASLDMFMKASYKRGMFCFVPLIWFYIMANKKSLWLFQRFI